MSSTFTPPNWWKGKPHPSAEKQVGDADPNGRADVANRAAKAIYAKIQQLVASLGLDGLVLDFTDASTAITGVSMAVPIKLTNSATGSTAVGDVLAVSSQTAILGDTVSSQQKFVIAQAVIANAAAGPFATAGVVSAKSTGAIAAMQYVRKSATARCIEDAGVAVGAATSPPAGTVGIALAAASGGFCTILLFERPVQAALETGANSDVTGSRALDTIYQNTSGRMRRVIISVDCDTGEGGILQIDSTTAPASERARCGITVAGSQAFLEVMGFVPNNHYYRLVSSGSPAIRRWTEVDE